MVEHELMELVCLKAEQRIEVSRMLVLQLFDLVLDMPEVLGRMGFLLDLRLQRVALLRGTDA